MPGPSGDRQTRSELSTPELSEIAQALEDLAARAEINGIAISFSYVDDLHYRELQFSNGVISRTWKDASNRRYKVRCVRVP